MSIEYRTVDVEATEANILRERALEAEARAYQQEVEALRLEALESVATTKEEKSAIKQAAKDARAASEPDRKRAGRLNKDGAASKEDLAGARRNFLETRIPQLEG